MRFSIIARENNHKFLLDRETMKEYPLTIETLINIANHLNDEILSYEESLIDLGEEFKEKAENQEGLLLGGVAHVSFDTVVNIMNLESQNHKVSNYYMVKKYAAFDENGKLKELES